MGKADSFFPIETKNLTKEFGRLKAVDKVSIKIKKGEIFALIGPNGAGKTTLIKMLVGLLSPTKGEAKIFGFDVEKNPLGAKEKFGYISDNPTAYEFLTGMEFLSLTGNLRGVPEKKLTKKIKQLAHLFPLGRILNQPISGYSRGNRQKVAFLAVLLAQPQLLIIDEPVAGLDPESIEIFGRTLKKFAKEGGTVFFVTHILEFGQKYADRVSVMNKGKIVTEKKVSKRTSLQSIYRSQTE